MSTYPIREQGQPVWTPATLAPLADLFAAWLIERTDGGLPGSAVAVSTEDTALVTLATAQPA